MSQWPLNQQHQPHHQPHVGHIHVNHRLTGECWAPWHDLTHCVVGTCVTEHYFDGVRDAKVREPLRQMLRETAEDLEHLARTIQSMGVTVIRPPQDDALRLNIRRPQSMVQPVETTPRDMATQIGPHTVYRSQRDRGLMGAWLGAVDVNAIDSAWFELLSLPLVVEPPCWTQVGDRLIVDLQQYRLPSAEQELIAWGERWMPGVTVLPIDAGCHIDGWFQCIKPGVILTCAVDEDLHIFNKTFPGWQIHQVKGIHAHKAPQMQFYGGQKNNYWLPNAKNNFNVQRFIQDYLLGWTGVASESVFEVNSLMVNDHTMIACQDNESVRAWLKSHGVEMVVCPLRHRWFWDGGISCFTLAVGRKGPSLQKYI